MRYVLVLKVGFEADDDSDADAAARDVRVMLNAWRATQPQRQWGNPPSIGVERWPEN